MPLNRLKNTWRYYKQQSELPPLQAADILELIQANSTPYQTRQQLNYINIAMLILLVLFCQGG